MIDRLFQGRNTLPMLYQTERAECGLACIAMIASFHGKRIDIQTLRGKNQFSGAGASVEHVITGARSLELQCRALKLEIDELPQLKLPAILHWNMDHFVVLKEVRAGSIIIHDPAIGIRKYSTAELGIHLTGIAIELSPLKSFKREDLANTISLKSLIDFTPGFYKSALQVLLLSLIVQLLALAMPFYVQLILDQGLANQEADLIVIIAGIFLTITVAKAVVGYLRGLILIYLSNQLGFQMVSNVFSHLLQLPVGYFERRHIGDIVSRFSSLDKIKQLITQDMISVFVDGLFSIFTIGLLFIYSPLLATIALLSITLISLVRLFAIPTEKIGDRKC
jgi:ATP-binding cassette subfamily B protein RaxB